MVTRIRTMGAAVGMFLLGRTRFRDCAIAGICAGDRYPRHFNSYMRTYLVTKDDPDAGAEANSASARARVY